MTSSFSALTTEVTSTLSGVNMFSVSRMVWPLRTTVAKVSNPSKDRTVFAELEEAGEEKRVL